MKKNTKKSNIKRKRKIGFFKRMENKKGRKIIKNKRRKKRKKLYI